MTDCKGNKVIVCDNGTGVSWNCCMTRAPCVCGRASVNDTMHSICDDKVVILAYLCACRSPISSS